MLYRWGWRISSPHLYAYIMVTKQKINIHILNNMANKKKRLEDIYSNVENIEGIGVLYTRYGAYSSIFVIENPIEEYTGDEEVFYEINSLWGTILKMLGEGYALQKQDILVKSRYHLELDKNAYFLQKCYANHFEGREYKKLQTYLIITKEAKKNSFFQYDKNKWKDFIAKTTKLSDILNSRKIKNKILSENDIRNYVNRYYGLEFEKNKFSIDNFRANDTEIEQGKHEFKIISVIDTENISLPQTIAPFTKKDIGGSLFPIDLTSFLYDIPNTDLIIYNQAIIIPNQRSEWGKLVKKKNRHSSLPDTANSVAVEDIDEVQKLISKDNKMLVYVNFSILICTKDGSLEAAENFIENSFSHSSILPSKNSYNQLELFMSTFPGNTYKLNPKYDRFLCLHDSATCFIFNEKPQTDENTPLKTYYTNRRGIPVCIDITGREVYPKKTDNSNFACLGSSGTGKSFNMNAILRQLVEQNTDVVIVDTGNSYEGLCNFFNGTYITYTKEKPITMNPFKITYEEFNLEKIEFLKSLLILLWKEKDDVASNADKRYLTLLIKEYYANYFSNISFSAQEEQIKKKMREDWQNEEEHDTDCQTESQLETKIKYAIADAYSLFEKQSTSSYRVLDLSFNSFYEFAQYRLPKLMNENKVAFDYGHFFFLLKAFYKGGEYEDTLNSDIEGTLFDEQFIVFEVDEIKDHQTLFPIVTLIIMDVFLQKMRIKKSRKALVIEEAWKAIASPVMAEHIKYLYKTVRKHRGIIGVVTQELKDIVGNEVVKDAIISNSDITILLDQRKFKDNYEEIADLLSLGAIERAKVFSINELDNKSGRADFKEVYIRVGKVGHVFGVEEPKESYMTYTTERIEKEALKLYLKKCNNIEDAILEYCKDWNNSGIKNPTEFAKIVFDEFKDIYV